MRRDTVDQQLYDECYQQYFHCLSLENQVMLDLHALRHIIKERPTHIIEYFLNLESRPMLILENEKKQVREGGAEKTKSSYVANLFEQFERVQEADNPEISQTYIGYLFIEGKLPNNEIVKGPVFLMPIQFVKSDSGLYFNQHRTRKCLINYPLLHKIAVAKNISLPALKSVYEEVTKQDFRIIKRFLNAVGLYFPRFSLETTPFVSHTEKSFPAYKEGRLRVQNQLVLGKFEHSPVFERCCDLTNQKTTQEIQRMMASPNLLSHVVSAHLTKKKKPNVNWAKGGVMKRKNPTITMQAMTLSGDTKVQQVAPPRLEASKQSLELDSTLAFQSTQVEWANLNQPMDLELMTLNALQSKQNVLIVCQSDTNRQQVVQQLNKFQTLQLPVPLTASNLMHRKTQLNASTSQITEPVNSQTNDPSISEGLSHELNRRSKSEIKHLLAQITEPTIHQFVTHHQLINDYPSFEGLQTLLKNHSLEVLLTDLNQLITVMQRIEAYNQDAFSPVILKAMKQNDSLDVVINEQLTSEKLALETMQQSFLVRVLDAKKIEQQQALITQKETQLHQMYQVFTEGITALTNSQAFNEVEKEELLETVCSNQSIMSTLLKQQSDLQVISTFKQTNEAYDLIPKDVIDFLTSSELTDELALNQLMSKLTQTTQLESLQALIKQIPTDKQRQLDIEAAHTIWNTVTQLPSFEALEQDVSSNKELEMLIRTHHEQLLDLYPICVMTDKMIELMMPTLPNLFDVIFIEETHIMKPDMILKLMTQTKQVIVYQRANIAKPVPKPKPKLSPTSTSSVSPQIKVSPHRIR